MESIFTALTNVKPSQLADRDLFDFASLTVEGRESSAEPAPSDQQEERVLKWMPVNQLERGSV